MHYSGYELKDGNYVALQCRCPDMKECQYLTFSRASFISRGGGGGSHLRHRISYDEKGYLIKHLVFFGTGISRIYESLNRFGSFKREFKVNGEIVDENTFLCSLNKEELKAYMRFLS